MRQDGAVPDGPSSLPAASGSHRGLAWARFDPDGPALGGVLVLHGADSSKERQADFASRAAAAGIVALTYDQRGHGETGGEMGGTVLDDVAAMAALLREALPAGAPVALRGSSLGGYLALVGASAASATAVVAVCPAGSRRILRVLHEPGHFAFACDLTALDALVVRHDERLAVASEDRPLLLMHAVGDETVPVADTRALAESAPNATYVQLPGGHHQTAQHDPQLLAFSVAFLVRELTAAAGVPAAG